MSASVRRRLIAEDKQRKYDPIARKHVLFEEKKLSKLKKRYVPGVKVEADTTQAE